MCVCVRWVGAVLPWAYQVLLRVLKLADWEPSQRAEHMDPAEVSVSVLTVSVMSESVSVCLCEQPAVAL